MEEPRVEIEREEENEEEIKWLNHYSSVQQILLVGEGDFSFSLSLANAFGSATNMVSTSLDSYDTVLKKYRKAKQNLENLKELGGTVLHEVDATKMKFHPDMKMRKFDRVVFNFPHAGFKGKEDNNLMIRMHRRLVNGFFNNAIHMLRPFAEVHISHKMTDPFHKWNLEELASNNCLILIECANFRIDDYPGYNNKRGDGARSDLPFPLDECSTFRFRIGDNLKRKKPLEVQPDLACGSSVTENITPNLNHLERFSTSSYPPVGFGVPRTLDHPLRSIRNAYLKSLVHNFGYPSIAPDLGTGYQAYEHELPGSVVSGNLGYFGKLHYERISQLKILILRHGSQEGNHEAYTNILPDRTLLGD